MGLSHLAAAGLAMAVVLGGCNADTPSDGSEPIGGTVTPSPTPSPSPTPTLAASVDITQVPDEIDEAYVAAVLAEYERVFTMAMNAAADEGTVFIDDFALPMQAWWTEHFLGRIQPVWERNVSEFPDEFRDELRPRPRRIDELVVAEAECVVVDTTTAGENWIKGSEDDGGVRFVTALVPKDSGSEDPREVNGTPWLINYDADPGSGEVGGQLCSQD